MIGLSILTAFWNEAEREIDSGFNALPPRAKSSLATDINTMTKIEAIQSRTKKF